MRWPLAEASLRDARRVVAARLRSHRRAAVALAPLLPGTMLAALWLGRALGGALGPVLAGSSAARSFVAGLVLTALAAGLALGAAVPSLLALGAQAAAADAATADRAAAILAAPVGAVLTAGALVGLPLGLPVAAASPGGVGALVPLAVVVLAAVWLGGAVAAALRCDGALRRGAACLAVGGGVPALALPGAAAGDALAGETAVAAATLGAAPPAALALAAWGLLATVDAEPGAAARGRRRLPRFALGATAVAASRVLLGRRDLRAALGGGAAIGLAGVALARAAGAPPPAATLLGVTGAALAAAPAALAVGGALRGGGHVWLLAAPRGVVAAGWLLASAAVMLAPASAVCLVAAVVERGPLRETAVALGLATGAWGAAVAAGAVAPWRVAGVAEQALSVAVFAGLCGLLSAALALLGPRGVEAGLPPLVPAGAVLAASIAGALAGLAGVLRSRD